MPRFALALVLLAAACSKPPGVEGDLSMAGAKGAYRTVSLVRNADDAVLTAADAACQAERDEIQRRTERLRIAEAQRERFKAMKARTSIEQVRLSDSVEKYRNAAAAERLALTDRPDTVYPSNLSRLRAAVDTELQADGEGHYKFVDRRPGQYLLYADWANDNGDVFAPVVLGEKGIKKQNLDQSTVSARLRCK